MGKKKKSSDKTAKITQVLNLITAIIDLLVMVLLLIREIMD